MDVSKLPRDLQLYLFKSFDIDTRIKLKMVFKLKVPDSVSRMLSSALKKPEIVGHATSIALGQDRKRYRICRNMYNARIDVVEHWDGEHLVFYEREHPGDWERTRITVPEFWNP